VGDLYTKLEEAAAAIRRRTGHDAHDLVVVLGSGLGDYGRTLERSQALPYGELGFPIPQAVGHRGTAYSAQVGDRRVLLLAGRVHAYEGLGMEAVTFPVRAAILAGARKVVLTNAAGGCADNISPGDLVLITDHLNMSGISPLLGANDERLGPRFPDMTDVYTPELRATAHAAAAAVGQELKEAVYFWWHGPMFETPAEVRMARMLGAGLVGMSTVPEATAARHMGAEVLGLSLCTNRAAGLSAGRLKADEVIEVATAAAGRVRALFNELLPAL
jgi:purine-nucleoside phosphorylase